MSFKLKTTTLMFTLAFGSAATKGLNQQLYVERQFAKYGFTDAKPMNIPTTQT
jgi:hypothetical protein